MKNIKKALAGFLAGILTLSCSVTTLNDANANDELNSFAKTKNNLKSKNKDSFWQDQIIYFVFTDRFSNGDKNNDFNVKANDPWAYHGGDIQGVINKLDYIKDLGATTIWITPPMDNRDTAFKADFGGGRIQDMYGYHGYWFKDFFAVDEHLGTMAKLQELVTKAHSKGIKILVDIVVNHLDYDHPFAKDKTDPKGKYYPWFNHEGKIHDNEWSNQWKVEHGELAELPDLNQENPEVYDYLLKASKWWISQTKADGFRIDTIKHVGHNFWKKYTNELHSFAGNDFMLLGEVYEPSSESVAGYINDGLDSAFDFPLYYQIKEVFGQGKSMRQLANFLKKDSLYPNSNMLSPFIDNHDVPRFLNEAGNNGVRKLKSAISLIMTVRGIPTVYYGTEIAMPGGADPDNRRDMEWTRKNDDVSSYMKKLTAIRKKYVALRRGNQLEMWQDDQIFAFLRSTENSSDDVITVMNNSDQSQTRTIKIRAESKMEDGTRLQNLLGTDAIIVNNKSLTVTLSAGETKVFAASAGKK
ncbi:MAG: alpha-amylase family glycosyl hydrolase [Cyanobacteriota bacterium]|mgnify:CR=1 FL=1